MCPLAIIYKLMLQAKSFFLCFSHLSVKVSQMVKMLDYADAVSIWQHYSAVNSSPAQITIVSFCHTNSIS